MLVSSSSIGSIRSLIKVLGVDKRNIKKAFEQCVQMDIVNNAF
jgi:soluble P-type ATPase